MPCERWAEGGACAVSETRDLSEGNLEARSAGEAYVSALKGRSKRAPCRKKREAVKKAQGKPVDRLKHSKARKEPDSKARPTQDSPLH